MFIIQLTTGPCWQQPSEIIDRRECQTDSIAFALAEARFWLTQRQRAEPHRLATHYRIIDEQGQVLAGGPP